MGAIDFSSPPEVTSGLGAGAGARPLLQAMLASNVFNFGLAVAVNLLSINFFHLR
jgi:hypothetical protein